MSPLAIRCEGLRKRYPGRPPVEAVRGLDLRVEVGECIGLLGPNGAGKTTTVEILEGLLPADAGEVEILGLAWARDAAAIRPRIGISLQETKLPEKLSVVEVLRLFRSFYARGLDPGAVMDRVGIADKARAWVRNLSGGLKQRLAVACALVGDPELLFLDEPTTGLDPQARRQIWAIVHAFRGQGRTVLLTTHYMEEAERLCDRVAIVDGGRVIALGTPAELVARLGGDHVIEIDLRSEGDGELSAVCAALDGVESIRGAKVEEGRLVLSVVDPTPTLSTVLARLGAIGRAPSNLRTRPASLEDLFISLTGRRIDDDGPGGA
jgi:ABC-2 type transport system ATP-binding protein